MKRHRPSRKKKTLQQKLVGIVLLITLMSIGLSIIHQSKKNKLERRIDNRKDIVNKLNSGK